jgi:hypothetical protein
MSKSLLLSLGGCPPENFARFLEHTQPLMAQLHPFKLNKFARSPRISDTRLGMLSMRSMTLETLGSLGRYQWLVSVRGWTIAWEERVRLYMPFSAFVNHFVNPSQFILANVDCLFAFGETLPYKLKKFSFTACLPGDISLQALRLEK